MRADLPAAFALLALATALSSCRTMKFYGQAVRGQAQILRAARPISHVRAAPETPGELRRQLDLVEELRTFAQDTLKLPTHRQYRSYADLGRSFVVWNVVAAPEFSLEAKTWWYPFVGALKYRGFFSQADAMEEAGRLKAQGFDVFVGGVRVYSTLGIFSDPVLNTFINEEEPELAETLFHELTHARFFVSGDTDFNEAYATASAQLGVRQWLRAKGAIQTLLHYEESLRRDAMVLNLLKDTRRHLGALYAKRDTAAPEDTRKAKASQLAEARAEIAAMKHNGALPGRTPPGKSLNNARLATLAAYHDLVPAFTRLFHRCGGDWERFHQAVEAMKPLSKAQRRQLLEGTSSVASQPRPNPS